MSATYPDRYRDFANSGVGGALSKRLRLPRPAVLRRHVPGAPLLDGPALVTGTDAAITGAVTRLLESAGVPLALTTQGADLERLAAVVQDATALTRVADLDTLHGVLAPAVKRLGPNARLLVLTRPVEAATDPETAATRAAVLGMLRSVAKELRAGATGNLLAVADGAEDALESSLRFFLSARSAFVSGQAVRISAAAVPPTANWERPLDGRVAVVTGAAQGIGAAIAATLARDGTRVICADLAAQGERLATVANRIGGTTLQLDITDEGAAERLAEHARGRHGGLDIVVHNAGITRDRLFVNMTEQQWSSVLKVNLASQLRINERLRSDGLLGAGARVVCVSSTSGIAGNRGQANYAASKAGVIGLVRASAAAMAADGATINAVAPGFIETEMTAAMPLATRTVARRINSLQQGGLPVDVAETVAWLGQAASAGVNGQVVRVCGQSLVGA